MSVYRPSGSSIYIYDFRRGGRRFFGSTEERTKKAAKAVENEEIKKAEELVRKQRELKRKPMSIDVAFGRYWNEIGQHAASAGAIETVLDFCMEQLGATKRLDEVTDADIADLIAVRRTHERRAGKVDGKQLYKKIENATVNRTTQILRRVFKRAEDVWNVLIIKRPNWASHMLPEPEERVREARLEEEDKLFEAVRDDYHEVMEFARVTGLRLKATVCLTWPQVDWENREIRYQKKRRRAGEGVVWRTIPLSRAAEAILRRCLGHHETAVFTYVAARTRDKRIKGRRYPMTYNGLKTQWRRDRAESGVTDFRWHDWRHTAATRTLRSTNNLAIVQELLGHEDVETTRKYAHVMKSDVAAAMDKAAEDLEKLRESQGKSQGTEKKVV